MPRYQSNLWEPVTIVEYANSKPKRAKCKHCYQEFAVSGAARIQDHLSSICRVITRSKDKVKGVGRGQTDSPSTSDSYITSMKPITSRMDSVDATAQEDLDHLLTEAFYTGGIPFPFIENKYFKRFVAALKPAYKLPSRNVWRTNFLEVYNETQESMNKHIEQSSYLNVVHDG